MRILLDKAIGDFANAAVKAIGGIQRAAIPFAKVMIKRGGQGKLGPAEPVNRLPVIPDGKERGLAVLPA